MMALPTLNGTAGLRLRGQHHGGSWLEQVEQAFHPPCAGATVGPMGAPSAGSS